MNIIRIINKALHINWKELLPLLRQLSKDSGRSMPDIFRDIVRCYSNQGITWSDYAAYGFHLQRDPAIRDTFMGQYEMEELLDRVNTREDEHLMEDKTKLLAHFKPFVRRSFCDLREVGLDGFKEMLGKCKRIFAKTPISYGGKGIRTYASADVKDPEALYNELTRDGLFLIEEGIVQHPEMAKLSKNSVNTIRIGTAATKDGVYSIPYQAIRLSLGDSFVDNASSGGASGVLSADGKIQGPLITYLPTVRVVEKHPETGVVFEGFQVPMFDEVKALCLEAAKTLPGARFIGWDIAVTPEGPDIVEVNANPSPALAQSYASLPDGRGKKQAILDALGETLSGQKYTGL